MSGYGGLLSSPTHGMSSLPESDLPSLQPGRDYPQFVNPQDAESFKCPLGPHLLDEPMQTSCGCRFCEPCLNVHFERNGEPTKCPVGEESCEMLSRNDGTVNKDFCARRDMKKLKVYCSYKQCGCAEILQWGQLQSHMVGSCPDQFTTCPYSTVGCEFGGSRKSCFSHIQEKMQIHMALMNIERVKLEDTKQMMRREVNTKATELVNQHTDLQRSVVDVQRQMVLQLQRLEAQEEAIQRQEDFTNRLLRVEHEANNTGMREAEVLIGEAQALPHEDGDFSPMRLEQHEERIAAHEAHIQHIDLRTQARLTTRGPVRDGYFIMKINEYSKKKAETRGGESLYGEAFWSCPYGYKLRLVVKLSGTEQDGGKFMSVFIQILLGEFDNILPWPFELPVSLYLMDQSEERVNYKKELKPDGNVECFRKPVLAIQNKKAGFDRFIRLRNGDLPFKYVKDDTVFIKAITGINQH